MSILRLPFAFGTARSSQPLRVSPSRQRPFVIETTERLEERCLLALTTVQAATSLGALSTTPVDLDGSIARSFYGGDLYSFSVTQGQTANIEVNVPGSTVVAGEYRVSLYYASEDSDGQYDLNRLQSDPNLSGTRTRAGAEPGDNAIFISYSFDGQGSDLDANASATGLFYIMVDESQGVAIPAPNPLFSDGSPVSISESGPMPYTLRVQAQNPTTTPQPPIAVAQAAKTVENQAVSIDVLTGDSDPAGGTLTVSGVASASGGTANASAHGGTLSVSSPSSGVVSYTPPTGYTGTDTFTYTIKDSDGNTASNTVTITVSPPTVQGLPAVSFLVGETSVLINGGADREAFEHTITFDIPKPSKYPVVVNYALDTEATTATFDDFSGPFSGTVTIPPGSTQGSFQIKVYEGSISWAFNIHQPSDAPRFDPHTVAYKITNVMNGVPGAITTSIVDISNERLGRALIEGLLNVEASTIKRIRSERGAGKTLSLKVINSTRQFLAELALSGKYSLTYFSGDSVYTALYEELSNKVQDDVAYLNSIEETELDAQYTRDIQAYSRELMQYTAILKEAQGKAANQLSVLKSDELNLGQAAGSGNKENRESLVRLADKDLTSSTRAISTISQQVLRGLDLEQSVTNHVGSIKITAPFALFADEKFRNALTQFDIANQDFLASYDAVTAPLLQLKGLLPEVEVEVNLIRGD